MYRSLAIILRFLGSQISYCIKVFLNVEHFTYIYMLSHFSPVQLFVTPWTVACQVSLSMGFSKQEYWVGLPCLSPGYLPNPGNKPMHPYIYVCIYICVCVYVCLWREREKNYRNHIHPLLCKWLLLSHLQKEISWIMLLFLSHSRYRAQWLCWEECYMFLSSWKLQV